MAREEDLPLIEKKIVVTFDICSSTLIIEDLHKTENITKWRNLLIWIKNYLIITADAFNFTIYKFTGDGWILLFDEDTSGESLVTCLKEFCKQYKMRYKRYVEDFLETPPPSSGLTFGIDRGSLIKFVMNEQNEFVGRAINVACRLQGSIKDKDKSPQYKAIITKPLFNEKMRLLKNVKKLNVKRKLRNLAGGNEVDCVKIWLDS